MIIGFHPGAAFPWRSSLDRFHSKSCDQQQIGCCYPNVMFITRLLVGSSLAVCVDIPDRRMTINPLETGVAQWRLAMCLFTAVPISVVKTTPLFITASHPSAPVSSLIKSQEGIGNEMSILEASLMSREHQTCSDSIMPNVCAIACPVIRQTQTQALSRIGTSIP
jgi:hypothetical protein